MRWESTTGLSVEQLDELVARCDGLLGEWDKGRGRPRALSFFTAVMVTVAVLRKNLAQAVAGDFLNASQSTISRTFRYFRPVVAAVLTEFVPDVATACAGEVPLVDGTLVPTGNRAGQPELYSGKRHRAGVNVQVLATARRRLVALFAPQPGKTHDAEALRRTDLDKHADLADVVGDLGYLGTGIITGVREPPGRDLTEAERKLNKEIAKIRVPVEHVIAQVKQWQILATGDRGRLDELPDVIATVVALEFFRVAF